MTAQSLPLPPTCEQLPTVAQECRWLDFWRPEEWKISGMVSVGHDGNTVELLVSVGYDRHLFFGPTARDVQVWRPVSADFLCGWTPPRKDVVDALNCCAWELWNDGQARYFRVVYDDGQYRPGRVFESTGKARKSYRPILTPRAGATLVGYATKDDAKRATHANITGALYVEALYP